MLTLITPTGDRPEAFALCEEWIRRQTYSVPYQWIVVDDGHVPTIRTMGQEYVRREPSPWGKHTLAKNLRTAIPMIRGDKILFIEDDEWYAPDYLQKMSDWLDSDSMVGAGFARYYWPRETRYREFPEHEHASLCRTGIAAARIPDLLDCCVTDDPSIDLRLWRSPGKIHACDLPLVVGMKGMPGRRCGGGSPDQGSPDEDLGKLTEWIGPDVLMYLPVLPKLPAKSREKIVVYTVCVGGYDDILPPTVIDPDVRYVAITDGDAPAPWQVISAPPSERSLRHQSRYCKIMGPSLFPKADWTIYHDGQLQLSVLPSELLQECRKWQQEKDLYLFNFHDRNCIYEEASEVARIGKDDWQNLSKQVLRYRAEGFPEASGMYLGGMLIRNRSCKAFNETWWNEVSSGSYRDQVSLPYALKKSGVNFGSLPALWWTNFFNRHGHKKAMPTADCSQFPSGSRTRSVCEGGDDIPVEKTNQIRQKYGIPLLNESVSFQAQADRLQAVAQVRSVAAPASDAPKKKPGGCGCSAKKPATKPPVAMSSPSPYGPGTRLINLFKSAGFVACEACYELARKMNQMGNEQCEQQIDMIVDDIMPRAIEWEIQKAGWWARLVPEAVTKEAVRLIVLRAIRSPDAFSQKKRTESDLSENAPQSS